MQSFKKHYHKEINVKKTKIQNHLMMRYSLDQLFEFIIVATTNWIYFQGKDFKVFTMITFHKPSRWYSPN